MDHVSERDTCGPPTPHPRHLEAGPAIIVLLKAAPPLPAAASSPTSSACAREGSCGFRV